MGDPADELNKPSGSQTLLRGLDVLEGVAAGALPLAELAKRLRLTRSTTHRLASALMERGYLVLLRSRGYQLGPKLLELGFQAQQQVELAQVARPHLEMLAEQSKDTVHLGVLREGWAVYLDMVPGNRRLVVSGRVGDRRLLTSNSLGQALLLGENLPRLREFYDREQQGTGVITRNKWLESMHDFAQDGYSYAVEEEDEHIRSVASPVRDASGRIVAAVSVSSAAQYMPDERVQDLADQVRRTADAIGGELGGALV